jgi:FimV-like protein
MITAIIQSYYSLFLTVGIAAIFFFLLGVYFILKLSSPTKKAEPAFAQTAFSFHPQDFSAIAGDDVLSTQLDLARAYIESDKKELAKMILRQVIASGTDTQQKEAQRLLDFV